MKINTEYRKGIIFLRLSGTLNKRTALNLEDKVNELVIDDELTNIVINLNNVKKIDMKGISTLYHIYETIKKYKGNTLICVNENENLKKVLKREKILNYISDIDSELVAFNLIRI